MTTGTDKRADSIFYDDMLEDKMTVGHFETISIDNIDIEKQVRDKSSNALSQDSIVSLASSLTSDIGILQPPVVFRYPVSDREKNGRFLLILGERRIRAVLHSGGKDIDCRVITNNDPCFLFKIQLAENEKREDLNAIEKYTNYIRAKNEFNLSTDEIETIMNISKDTIYRLNSININNFTPEYLSMFRDTVDLRLLSMFSKLIVNAPSQAHAFLLEYEKNQVLPARSEVQFYLDHTDNSGGGNHVIPNRNSAPKAPKPLKYSFSNKFGKSKFTIPDDQLDLEIEIDIKGKRTKVKLSDIVNIKGTPDIV